MQEEKKENKAVEFFKNKRKRSAVMLVGWLIFISVLIGLIRSNQPPLPETPIDSEDTFASYEKYNYEYEIKESDEIYSLLGTRHRTKDKFTMNDSEYYLIDSKLYVLEDDYLVETDELSFITLTELYPDKLSKFIKDEYLYATTNYQNNKVETTYQIPIKDFNQIETEEIAVLKVITINDEVVEVIFDLTNLFLDMSNGGYSNLEVTMKYSNINNIENFDIPEILEVEY